MPQHKSNPYSSVVCACVSFAFFSIAAGAACAQKYEPPPPALTAAPCVPTKKVPCALPPADTRPTSVADQNPFPGEPAQPASTTVPSPTQQENPFPGEPPAESSSSSSSSSSDSASPEDGKPAAPAGSTRFARKHLPKVEDTDGREAKDLEISRYYFSTGNFQAAYLRAKDATTTIPDDSAAHFYLAEAANRLNKPDEAIAEYATCIKLEPDGEHVLAASKAIALLSKAHK